MYNCESQVVRVVDQVIKSTVLFDEILFVDNCSTDNTIDAVYNSIPRDRFRYRIVKNIRNIGLGGSHKVAFRYMLENEFTHCVVLHGDDQASISDFAKYINDCSTMQTNYLGSRFMSGSKLLGYSFTRIAANNFFNYIYSITTGKKIYDIGSGLNLYTARGIELSNFMNCPDDLTFSCQFLLNLVKSESDYLFVPISWREFDQISNVKAFRQTMRILFIAITSKFPSIRKYKSCVNSDDRYSYKVIYEN